LKKFLLSTLLAGALSFSPAWAEPPARYVLPNGIPLVVQESYSSPTVSINIYIRVGSVFEKPELSGISHFYEHMFFRGTPTRSGLKFKRDIESLGGITNATTGRDFTHFYINLPKQYVRQGLELLADAYLHAECSQESVDAERKVVLEEYRLGLAQPARQLAERLYQLCFPNHPYGRTIIGSEDNLKTGITRQHLLDFKRDYYVPNRTKLVVAGDVDADEVLLHCKELFGSYQAKGSVEDKLPVETAPEKTVVLSEVSKSGQAQVAYAFLGPSVKERQDVYRVDVLSFMLGHGKNSLLGKALDSKKTSLDAQMQYLTQAYPGVIMLIADAEAGKEEETVAKIETVLEQARTGQFSEQDIQRARKLLSTSYRFGTETNAGKADSWGFYETIDKMDFATHYLDGVAKVTKQDLTAAAQKYFGRGHYRLVLKAPGKSGVSQR
jgi:zinc protease